jgi:hypothetical protein
MVIPVRFPCIHEYHRPHFGEGGKLDNLKKRGAKWCKGGEWVELREVNPSRVAILTDDDRKKYTVYLREEHDE